MKQFAGGARLALLVASIGLLTSVPAIKASTISILGPGNNRVTLYTDAGGAIQDIDVRGQTFLSVTTLGAGVTLVDALTGANTSAFRNGELLGANPGVPEAPAIFMDFMATTLGPTELAVRVLVAPLTAITDSNLAALTSLTSLDYVLAISRVTQGSLIVYQHDLAGSTTAVPEPAHWGQGGSCRFS